ncbi:MAG: DHH family phosphoesterase [Clostridium chrysemydis]|uniref:DHH family phosphoesterase n=1 Tax=Clostridium chrysemydis TaxID=2665504 RepID=UPI003F369E77
MKYKVINKNKDCLHNENLLHVLLQQRGVKNPEELMNLDDSCIHDGMLLNNMDRGLNMLYWHLTNGSSVHVIDDSDFDGYSSAALCINYIRDIGFNNKITFSIHTGKEHGIVLKELKDYNFDLLIVPDAGSSDMEQCKELKDKDILILDHHNFETLDWKDIDNTIVINCQDGKYPNNTLSGVGVTYKFLKEFDKKYGYNKADNYLDLVALGMVADDMDLRNSETRYLVLSGLNKLNKSNCNLFIKEIMDKNNIDKLNILDVGWKIAPLINGVVRVGTMEEKEAVFKALINTKEDKEYQPRKKKGEEVKPPLEIQSLQKYMAREIKNIKASQDRTVKKGVELVNKKIKEEKLNNNKMIIVDVTQELEKTFTGLVANKLAGTYKRPVILLRQKEHDTYGGSGRNYKLSSIESLQEFLNHTKLFNWINGHDNAFGFNINKNNIDSLVSTSNYLLQDVEIEDCYWVDYEIPVGRLKPKNIIDIGKWKDVWGNTLQEPQFAITDIYVKPEDVQLLGSKKNIIKINKTIGDKTISFIKFFANEDMYNKMILKSTRGLNKKTPKKLKFTIIGKFNINEWEGKEYPQIEIIDYEVTEGRKIEF